MTIRQTTLAAAFALAAIGPAHAEGLKPLQGQVIDLGDVSGVAYFTVERDGFRVVATLAKKGEEAVRCVVEAVLDPGQSLTLSTPHEAGTPARRGRLHQEGRHGACPQWRRRRWLTRCSPTRRPRRSRTERGPPNRQRRERRGSTSRLGNRLCPGATRVFRLPRRYVTRLPDSLNAKGD